MRVADFSLRDTTSVISPALLYHLEAIEHNLRTVAALAGGVDRLWPHVKSHKTRELIELSIRHGVTRFKCATIAEAETAANAHAENVLVSYPLIGPNIDRFIRLAKAFPNTTFWAMGDNEQMLELLSEAALEADLIIPTLLDINTGMDRTGVKPEQALTLFRKADAMRGLQMRGLHCYDGENHQIDAKERLRAVERCDERVGALQRELDEAGLCCDTVIMGGTPSFAFHTHQTNCFLSPGTAFLFDCGYGAAFPEMDLIAAAAVFTRVISHPADGIFTLDLGYKGIAADPPGVRGMLLNIPNAIPMGQSEEHWCFRMKEGHEAERPPIGSAQYVVPTHVCPTSALYKSVQIVQNGQLIEEWNVIARDRRLTF